ncbi:SpoIID/LytB domain-containing protein [Parabacteroides sp. OttesenSCG-928-G07]|nr:SpoIID/LytB domain-containing protein [Parabacteroides sp. OttesenSCG-928-G07]
MEAPVINVGILTNKAILFVFNDEYVHIETGNFLVGEQRALYVNNKIIFNGKLYDELFFEPTTPTASFHLKAVTIGVDFHWERKEDLQFQGALNLVIDDERIVAINQVNIENYLVSVISSEMSATASKEFLKAHAVISRSWLLAQVEKKQTITKIPSKYQTCFETENGLIKWYDREDHQLFDVCADDHCQRYQGITRASTPIVEEVIKETRGEVLSDGHIICDTRYSKCCGGVTERFETCWEPIPHDYLVPVRDYNDKDFPDLTNEADAENWIRTSPPAFCNTSDKEILSQVLNNYDQETADFYRWKVTYTQAEIAELIARKSGKNFGRIKDLIPLKRGPSGRIEKLQIVGTNHTFTIGKELEIRRTLSESHLFSSAFVVDKENVEDGIPGRFLLTGAGWGHGVGLCQIGAAVMGAKGYNYQEILNHYFQNAFIVKRY